MKKYLMALVLLGAGSAYAADDTIKVCNPQNPSQQSFEVSVIGNKMTTVSRDGVNVQSQDSIVSKTIVLQISDLREVAQAADLPVNLESGTAYNSEDGALVITSDAKGVKYLFMIGMSIQLLGSSDSCK